MAQLDLKVVLQMAVLAVMVVWRKFIMDQQLYQLRYYIQRLHRHRLAKINHPSSPVMKAVSAVVLLVIASEGEQYKQETSILIAKFILC